MRNAVFILAALYAIFFVVAFNNMSTSHMDAAGRSMAMGFLVVGAMITGALTLPALILAALNKGPKWALGLALAPMAIVILAIGSGVL